MAKWTYDEGGEGQTGGDSGGGGGTGTPPASQNQPAPAELKIFRLDSEGQNNVLVFSDFLNPLTNQFTISAEDVENFGDGTYRARIGDVFSNDFTIALTEVVPPPVPQGAINAKHYKFTPQRNIVETVINEVVGIDNGKVDVPVQFNMNYSIYNVAPPGLPGAGSLQVLDQLQAPLPTPQMEEVQVETSLTPTDFNFPAWYGTSGGERVVSEPRTISGITEQVLATVTGNDAHLQINDEQPTKQPRMVSDGDVIRLHVKRPRVGFDNFRLVNDPDNFARVSIGNFTTVFRAFYGTESMYDESPTPSPTPTPTPTPPPDDFDERDYGGS